MKAEKPSEKRWGLTIADLVAALLCFAAFLVAGLGLYYLSAGEFVSAQGAAVYAVLALVGAAAVLLRWRRFALLYYLGCGLGWWAGSFVGGLKGDFAPTAGWIVTFFLIAVFALFGAIAQWRAFRRKLERRREERERQAAQEEEDRKRAELDRARQERKAAEAALEAAAAPVPETKEGSPTQE